MFFPAIEKIIRPETFVLVQQAVLRSRMALFMLISCSGVLCSIYYAFFSRAFRREQRAVISGILEQSARSAEGFSFFRLRRNIHRIEKGLVMKPRRDVFALEYIGETVDFFEKCHKSACLERHGEELQWASDVLRVYFDNVGDHEIVRKAKTRFDAVCSTAISGKVPYKRGEAAHPWTYEEFLALAQRRKAVRWFLPKPVPRELIDKALEAAALSPSACNRQPFIYRIFDDPVLVEKISALPHGTMGFSSNIPVACALVGDLSAYLFERDRHTIYVDASLSAMTFMLALESVGLSSCPVNWPDIEAFEKQGESVLKLKKHERIIMFLAIGWADPEGLVAYSEKKNLEQIRRYN
ncbi:MAG TPA: nitroreductase family protein [Oligoflexia bacterium]|nr:nitroreductase family protein [Oligoflexia bacterium]